MAQQWVNIEELIIHIVTVLIYNASIYVFTSSKVVYFWFISSWYCIFIVICINMPCTLLEPHAYVMLLSDIYM